MNLWIAFTINIGMPNLPCQSERLMIPPLSISYGDSNQEMPNMNIPQLKAKHKRCETPEVPTIGAFALKFVLLQYSPSLIIDRCINQAIVATRLRP